MKTYIRSTPCRTCGGFEYMAADHRCVPCAIKARKKYSKAQVTRFQAIRDYAEQQLNSSDPAQAFMARVICTFAMKDIKTIKSKPQEIMNMLCNGEYDDLMIYDFWQFLVKHSGRAA